MLCNETARIYHLVFALTARTHCIGPLRWNAAGGKLQLLNSGSGHTRRQWRWRLCSHYINTLFELLATLVVVSGFAYVAFVNRHSITKIFEAGQLIMAFTNAGLAGIALSEFYGTEVMQLANTVLATNRAVRRLYEEELQTEARLAADARFNFICKAYIGLDAVLTAACVVIFMVPVDAPSESLNLYIFLGGTSKAWQLAFVLFMTYLIYKTVVRIMFVVFLLFASIFLLYGWLRLLKAHSAALHDGAGASISAFALRLDYQSLQVFNTVFRECFTPTILPVLLFGSCFVLIVVCTALILFHNQLPAAHLINYTNFAVLITAGVILMFGFMESMLEDSCDVVDVLRNASDDAEAGRRDRAVVVPRIRTPYYPIRFQFGGLFVAQAGTGLTAMCLSLEQVASLVLMYRA